MSALLTLLEGGAQEPATLHAAWAVANLLVDNPTAQAAVDKAGAADTLVKLLWEGPSQAITEAALYAVANAAANNKGMQDALRDAGAIEPLVKLLETATEGHPDPANTPFKAQVVQHLLTMQVNHPQLRAAIREVGGVDQLLELVESGVGIKEEQETKKYPVALYRDDTSEVDDDMSHGIAGIKRLVQTLQEQVEAGAAAATGSTTSKGTQARAFVLDHPEDGLDNEQVAALAAWALANLAANNADNQNAIRSAGGIEPLVSLLENASDKRTIKNASWALANLAKSNADNKAAIRKAKGIQGMLKLLEANPDDKDMVQQVARALKFMAADKGYAEIVSQHSSKLLRRWSRKVARLLRSQFNVQLADKTVSYGLVAAMVTGALTLVGTIAAVTGTSSRKRMVPPAAAKKRQ
jgi:hypothetical protein